ncbi:phosphopantothenate--cysteine ligase [uncultured Caudovirales phage]|uniref:Phosphopantothenate--cysteine ligase n=1 Tax=uncultured Caudovirales phage TaxID=2100421 RepID=A0A6J5RTF7_9CAUD|nr:phosphopantothenate--cysteine ligase [uncultured Caudovirales phage]
MLGKKVLITGGHTQIPIDKVRAITNIFKGKTACDIANFFIKDCDITLLGNPLMKNLVTPKCKFVPYTTYDDLYSEMHKHIMLNKYDVIIHSAAVSDYYVSGVLTAPGGEKLDSSSKISSSYDKLYLELSQTRKIVDDIRPLWGFEGYLVKFKLQVGISDSDLLKIARASRVASKADMIVANCLETAKQKAFIVTNDSELEVIRNNLPTVLYSEIWK